MDKARFVPSLLQQMREQLYELDEITPEFEAYTQDFDLVHDVIQAHAGILAVCLANFWYDEKGQATFEFDPEGVPTAVIEAILFDRYREPYVADLVAWPLHDPDGFATALGPKGGAAVLGAFHMPQRGGTPLFVQSTPLAWVEAGCEGCVPLNDGDGRYWLDKAGGPFLVRDIEVGRWLRDLLGSFASRHRILVTLDQVAA